MAQETSIAWTSHTFNPWRGCSKVSPGCAKCYAERLSGRNPKVLGEWGPRGTRVLAADAQWKQPVKWNQMPRPRWQNGISTSLVFCASLADVFEDWPGQMTDHLGHELRCRHDKPVSVWESISNLSHPPYTLDDARARLWRLIRATPWLTWQLLTKRPENIARMMPAGDWANVWLGTSVESQEYLWRLDALQEAAGRVQCPVRFCSAEPLLGPLDFGGCLARDGINWVIIGGESGGGARRLELPWCRSIINQCGKAGIACFVKQAGSNPFYQLTENPRQLFPLTLSGKGDDPEQWFQWMRVQEFPDVQGV